jgi:hypothetical protein
MSSQTYRAITADEAALEVIQVMPWDGKDESYWPTLYALGNKHALVLIDAVQHLANGNMAFSHARALEEFECPIVGLYAGNETKIGIGGDVGWSTAAYRFWVGGKPTQVHPLDTDEAPWDVTLPSPASVRASVRRSGIGPDQVRRLGELARSCRISRRGGPKVMAEKLLAEAWDGVAQIVGCDDLVSRDLSAAIGDHFGSWEEGLSPARGWAAAPLPDEPPF